MGMRGKLRRTPRVLKQTAAWNEKGGVIDRTAGIVLGAGSGALVTGPMEIGIRGDEFVNKPGGIWWLRAIAAGVLLPIWAPLAYLSGALKGVKHCATTGLIEGTGRALTEIEGATQEQILRDDIHGPTLFPTFLRSTAYGALGAVSGVAGVMGRLLIKPWLDHGLTARGLYTFLGGLIALGPCLAFGALQGFFRGFGFGPQAAWDTATEIFTNGLGVIGERLIAAGVGAVMGVVGGLGHSLVMGYECIAEVWPIQQESWLGDHIARLIGAVILGALIAPFYCTYGAVRGAYVGATEGIESAANMIPRLKAVGFDDPEGPIPSTPLTPEVTQKKAEQGHDVFESGKYDPFVPVYGRSPPHNPKTYEDVVAAANAAAAAAAASGLPPPPPAPTRQQWAADQAKAEQDALRLHR